MRSRAVIWILLAGPGLALPPSARAVADGFASGFYSRGVDAASYMDQGGAIYDPFYLPAKSWSFLPRATLAVTHDDNIFLDPEEGKANTSVSLVPGLLAIWGRPANNHVFADYGARISLHESEREVNDRPSHMLRLGVVYRTGKSQINAQAGLRHAEETDEALGARVTKRDYVGDLGVEHRLNGKSSLGLQGNIERHEYESERYVDYARYYGAGRYYRRLTPKSQGFVQGGIGRDEPLQSAPSASAADFYDLSLGVRGKQTPKSSIGGRVGYMWRRYDDERRGEYENWIASLRASSTPFGLTTLSAELSADIRPAVDAEGLDAVNRGIVLGVNRRLFVERLRGTASFTAGQTEYSGRPAGAAAEEDGSGAADGRTDDYYGFSLGVDWWTRKNFSLGLAYSYTRRDGGRDGTEEAPRAASYEAGRWTLRASWNY
jgi:hypothetical protein